MQNLDPAPQSKPFPWKEKSKKDLYNLLQEARTAAQSMASTLARQDQAQRNAFLAITGQLHDMEHGLMLKLPAYQKQINFLKLLLDILQGKEIKTKIVSCHSCPAKVSISDIPVPPDHAVYCEECAGLLHQINQYTHIIPPPLLAPIEQKWNLDKTGDLPKAKIKELLEALKNLHIHLSENKG